MIELHCKCGHNFNVPETARGTLAECPACEGRIFVPSASAAAESMDVAEQDRAPAITEALTSDEILALREETPPAGPAVPETQVVESDLPPTRVEGPTTDGNRPVSARETEVAAPAEDVVAGPEDSSVEGGAGGFAVRYDEEISGEQRRFDRCPQCDAELETGSRICTNCGFDLVTGERVTRVTVEEPDQAAVEIAADVGLGVLAFLATWIVKLRHVIIAASLVTFLITLIGTFVARHNARNAYRTEVSGGGLVGVWWDAAQEAVEKEAYDLEQRTREQVQLAMVKMQNEPEAEKGVFSRESQAAAEAAWLAARRAHVMERDPARAERILLAIGVLYGTMDWGQRAREELARVRGAAGQPVPGTSRPTASAPATRPASAPTVHP